MSNSIRNFLIGIALLGLGAQVHAQETDLGLVPDAETKRPIAQNQYCIAPAGDGKIGALLSLSRKDKVKMNPRKTEVHWYYRESVENAEKVIFRAILITAICGTFIWGYGHRVFESTC